MVPTTHASGGRVFNGRLLWQCNKWLRWALVEASWSAIQFSSYFGGIYRNARARGKNKNVAITVVAHRMAKIIWLLLNEQRPYTETLPDQCSAWRIRDQINYRGLAEQNTGTEEKHGRIDPSSDEDEKTQTQTALDFYQRSSVSLGRRSPQCHLIYEPKTN